MRRNAWVGKLLDVGSLAVRVVGIALLVYAVLMFSVQRRLVFPGARRDSPRSTAAAPSGARQIWLEASFGRVEAWFFPANDLADAPTVVFAHGNGELIEDWEGGMEMLRDEGVNALLVEFPGYGHSEGRPSRSALREVFTEAFDWLVEEARVNDQRIVAFGRSLGGGAAADLSGDRPVRALALQSTFSSAAAVARAVFLPSFLVLDRFDNLRAVAEFPGPVLLMHGQGDDVFPYTHAQRLASLRDDLEVSQIDCAHNDCAPVWPAIVSMLTSFLRENGLLDPASAPGDGG